MGQETSAVEFLVIGDWGLPTKELHNNGKIMASIVNKVGPQDTVFVAAVGDNFYPNGVESVDDPLWTDIFLNNFSGWHFFFIFLECFAFSAEVDNKLSLDVLTVRRCWL